MKNPLHTLLRTTVFLSAILITFLPNGARAQTGYFGPYFTVYDTSDIVYAYINNSNTNLDPSLEIQVTPNWIGTYDNFTSGVWYNATDSNEWAIYNESNGGIPLGSYWNVLVPNAHSTSYLHVATSSNISAAASFISDPLLKNNPNAIIFVTHNWNPDTSTLYKNEVTAPLGVYYSGSDSEWAIFDEDLSSFLPNTAYNVLIPNSGSDVFSVTATKANGAGTYIMVINNSTINGDSNAIILATQSWNPGGVGGTYNNHEIGVWYDGTNWTVFNQDLDSIPTGSSFNILYAGDRTATSGINHVSVTNNHSFMVYPNPVNATVNLRFEQPITSSTQIDVFNLLGQNVYELQQNTRGLVSIDVSQWAEGDYFVRAMTGNTISTNSFVVSRH